MAFNSCPDAATLSVWYLTDDREADNVQTYKVKKMADGHIWMVQDLKFGNKCNKTAFTGSTSDQMGKVTTLSSGTYYGDCRNSVVSGGGYYYDWAATINKSGAYAGSSSNVGCSGTASGLSGTAPAVCQGICPEGWHIPTGTSIGEYMALHTAIGNCSTNNDDCWDANSAWEGVISGRSESNGSISGVSSDGRYWTSSYSDQHRAYFLRFYGSGVCAGTCNDGSKNVGRTIRCVKNY
jgi:uncharacterized protein (TIGR02145 family)